MSGEVDRLLVVLGDQLDGDAPLLHTADRSRDAILMMEVADEATHVPSHTQRTTLFLSAMRHFAAARRAEGWRVRYVELDDSDNTHTLTDEVVRAADTLAPNRLVVTQPGEHRVLASINAWRRSTRRPVDVLPDTHFLTSPDEFTTWAQGRRELVMEHFYRTQRRRHDVLMNGRKPVGDTWNFDKENRASLKTAPDVAAPRHWTPDATTRAVMRAVTQRFPDAPGVPEPFAWPVTRGDARAALEDFVVHRLPNFGTYQDAMWTGEPFLYHSLLSPALNLKLLSPRECIDAAVDAFDRGRAPLNAVEGFVRQILGWREFIRGVYWHEGPDYADRNALDATGALPDFYWTGATDMACMAEAIGQVRQHAYGHHIHRLMITGNFALLAGIAPRPVADWYLGMFADGVDWVTLPNTVGMTLHADGGVVGTKPYAASGKYVQRMSNYCAGCRYDPAKRTGEDACPFTTLYWDFLIRHRERFRTNRRMAMILKNVDRFDAGERRAVQRTAADTLTRLGVT